MVSSRNRSKLVFGEVCWKLKVSLNQYFWSLSEYCIRKASASFGLMYAFIVGDIFSLRARVVGVCFFVYFCFVFCLW